ncbi:MAG: UbiA prenyltransferase family protein [Candidatus Hatepunaea meridiana]|nr:UbiA prenyltransferase family protein [Candidatus Hatepunaea meridiana]
MKKPNTNVRTGVFHLILRTIRPRHWIKNSFILAPALFTLHLLEPSQWLSLMGGVLGFSLIASAVYAFNDICNRHEDALHPIKKIRPVASGQLAVWQASLLSIVSLSFGLILLLWLGHNPTIIAITYAILMIAYSIYLRHVLILDVIIIAVGFVIRVMLGAVIINEPLSHWLILCTFTIALFLGMIKRRQEITSETSLMAPAYDDLDNDNSATQTRPVLTKYPEVLIINGWINILAAMTILCYALYTVDPHTIEKHHTGALIYTLPFVLYGIFRYQQLALVGRAGEDPTKLLLKDPGMKVVVLLWVVTVGVILYLAQN